MAFRMVNFLDASLGTPLKPCWEGLKQDQRVWDEGAITKAYYRGLLCPSLVKQIYCFPSEVLIDSCFRNTTTISSLHFFLQFS